MSEGTIIQLRKKGGLSKILQSKNGSPIRPMLYSSKTKDPREEGVLEGEYKGKSILNTKEFIVPTWDILKNQWPWAGNNQDLARLVKAMKLRYNKGHEKANQLITPFAKDGENEGSEISRLTDFVDPVFRNHALFGKLYMENGRINFNTNDPVQEFVYLMYKGSSSTHDKSSDKIVSPYVSAGTKFELVSPKRETQAKRQDADREVRAIQLLATMSANEEKMRAVATIMGLPHYSNTTDVNGLFLLLKDTAAQNTLVAAKYDKSYQERFIELAEMHDADLNVTSEVIEAKNKGLIRKKTDHYLINGERLDVKTDMQLMRFFRDDSNQDKYLELVELLKGKK